jgi:hypothetical protein
MPIIGWIAILAASVAAGIVWHEKADRLLTRGRVAPQFPPNPRAMQPTPAPPAQAQPQGRASAISPTTAAPAPTAHEIDMARDRFARATAAIPVAFTALERAKGDAAYHPLAQNLRAVADAQAAYDAAVAEQAASRANYDQLVELAKLHAPAPAPVAPAGQGVSVSGTSFGPNAVKFPIDESDPAIMRWIDPVTRAMTAQGTAPPAFAMAWLAIESGGKPCAIGEPGAKGPDGEPLELGLWQAYNPDDLKAAGMTGAELRAYCEAAPSQSLSRAMTPNEIERHMQLGVNLITRKRTYADHYLSLANVRWPVDGPDYWAAVKLPHAYPPIINTGLGQVVKHLGRAPSSWQEFRATYEQIEPRARWNPAPGAKQTPYFRGLQNAEWCGFHVAPTRAVS